MSLLVVFLLFIRDFLFGKALQEGTKSIKALLDLHNLWTISDQLGFWFFLVRQPSEPEEEPYSTGISYPPLLPLVCFVLVW